MRRLRTALIAGAVFVALYVIIKFIGHRYFGMPLGGKR